MTSKTSQPRDPASDEHTWETHPLTQARFEDFVTVVNKNRRPTHCWCLSHRINAPEIRELGGDGPDAREKALYALTGRRDRPGVITYRDGEPVGWCSISPRTAIPRLENSKLITPVDDLPVWSVICVVVRSGYRKQGVVGQMLEGAVAYAKSRGAPAVEAHPVDTTGGRMDLTMAFVGTRAMFEGAGFEVVGETQAKASGKPRLVMRRTL